MFFLWNEISSTVALSTVYKPFGALSISDPNALQFEWIYLLLCLLIGLLIGIRATYSLLGKSFKHSAKQNGTIELAAPRSISRQMANSINTIIRDLINSQFVIKGQGGNASYLQTPLRESIRQLRLISSHLQMRDVGSKVGMSATDSSQSAILASCTVRHIIEEQFALAQSYLDDCEMSLRYEFDDEYNVAVPADWLRKAIREIILNAVKHNKNKNGLRINLRVAATKHHVLLNICDNGQGIPCELTSAINHPSSELIELQSLTNPGCLPINLSAIQVYLLQQNGGLLVSSARHFVTKVSLKLPLVKIGLQAQESACATVNDIEQLDRNELHNYSQQSKLDSFKSKHHFPNLLIVNLDQLPISNARTVLYQHFSIYDASSLPQAVEMLKREKIDCLLVDVGNTATYTIDTFNFLRKHEQCKSIPSVIIGAEIDKTSQLQMLNLGLSALLVHPVQGEQISKVLKKLLQEKQMGASAINENLAEYAPQYSDITASMQDNAFVAKFQKVLRQHYSDEDFNRQLAAKHMLMHERTLHRRLSEHFGLSFTEILKKYRLQMAKQMIKSGDNITTASYETGFSSPSYFAQCFKAEFGAPPSTLSKHA